MARKKQEDVPQGSPAWMATFSDLMNLLLCFFVLLFSMSTVDAEKFQQIIASFQNTVSFLPSGGASIEEGQMITSGISLIDLYDVYYSQQAEADAQEKEQQEKDIVEAYEEQSLAESEEMAESIEEMTAQYGIQDQVEVTFNADYVLLSMSGAFLFDSGKAELRAEAYPLLDKIGKVLEPYKENMIDVEGHTDNVPIHSAKYADNDVLSMFRAYNVAAYLRDNSTIDPAHIKSSGRGEYAPIADNATPEGRARNRRVEIKVYNSYNSDID